MMPTNTPDQPDIDKTISQIKELITKNDSGIIAIPAKPTPDAIAAATALYMAVLKMGKNITLVASSVPESDILGVDKIKTDLLTGGDNLVISFPYEEGAIDKVDYNIQNERFNLIVIPREGHSKLEPKDVKYTYTGGKIDFIITIDTPNLNALGDIYQKNQREFDGKSIINIDRHLINNSYGMINMVVKTSSSTSELVLKVIKGLKVELNPDMATNLYAGVLTATNNFTAYSVNADTFESVAELLRAGAVKKPVQPMQQFGRPGMPQVPGMNPFGGMNPPLQQSFPSQRPMMQPNFAPRQQENLQQGSKQQKQQESNEQQTKSIDKIEQQVSAPEGNGNSKEAPENFLKPKIFSESGGIV